MNLTEEQLAAMAMTDREKELVENILRTLSPIANARLCRPELVEWVGGKIRAYVEAAVAAEREVLLARAEDPAQGITFVTRTELRRLVESSRSSSHAAVLQQIVEAHVAAAVEECAVYVESAPRFVFDEDEEGPSLDVAALMASHIRALKPNAATALQRVREEAAAQARLEEAKWWEHLVGAQHQLEGRTDCEPDCMYCERISALQAALKGSDK